MKTKIKVVGTTFHPLPENDLIIVRDVDGVAEVPSAMADVILMPEPSNQYDPKAVAVVVKLQSGVGFVLGYIPRDHEVKEQIKIPTLATMQILDYTQVGDFNPSFIITDIQI